LKAPDAETRLTLQIRRTFQVPRERVFLAWTDPDRLKQWWGLHSGFAIAVAEYDVREGGGYRLGLNPPGQDRPLICRGVYREIRPPERLVFTWSWEPPVPDIGETLVVVEFIELGTSTELVITHEPFPSKESRSQHEYGWAGSLSQLERYLAERM